MSKVMEKVNPAPRAKARGFGERFLNIALHPRSKERGFTGGGVNHYYITHNPRIQGGEPIIKGTRFPVRSVVVYVVKEGILPEELVKEFPHLSLAAIYDAISYYYDHTEEMEKLIENQKEELWKK